MRPKAVANISWTVWKPCLSNPTSSIVPLRLKLPRHLRIWVAPAIVAMSPDPLLGPRPILSPLSHRPLPAPQLPMPLLRNRTDKTFYPGYAPKIRPLSPTSMLSHFIVEHNLTTMMYNIQCHPTARASSEAQLALQSSPSLHLSLRHRL